jgi:glycosyltransferase involved in cell wall biosynthesis
VEKALILGLMRIKNEERWLPKTLPALKKTVEEVWVLDDHSTDRTVEIAKDLKAFVVPSPFSDLNEARDKSFLLREVRRSRNPSWCVMMDGDEELLSGSGEEIQRITRVFGVDSYRVRIAYLWNDEKTIRVDGMYRKCMRPSIFRVLRGEMHFRSVENCQSGFHCHNVPVETQRSCASSTVTALHYGYIDAELRRKKYDFYNRSDPGNRDEDEYRHVIQGDPGGEAAEKKLLHAGPLELVGF